MAVSDRMYNSIALAIDSQLLNGSATYPRIEMANTGGIVAYSQKVALMTTKRYTATVKVETNDVDKRDNSIRTNLLTIEIGADTLAELLLKAHGHIELVSEK